MRKILLLFLLLPIFASAECLKTQLERLEAESVLTLYNFANRHANVSYGIFLRAQCFRYGLSAGEEVECQKHMGKLTSDYFGGSQSGDLHFVPELVSMLNDPEVLGYVRDLGDYLAKLKSSGEPGDLWQFTLEKAKGDRIKATTWLGILFQDTSPDHGARSAVIENHFGKDSATTQAWERAESGLLRENLPPHLQLYPSFLKVDDDRLYHFYTIAHMSDGLKPHDRMSRFAPLVLNAVYEYTQLPDSSLMRQMQPEPKFIDLHEPSAEAIVRGVYLSYAAALWADGRQASVLPYSEFLPKFAADPNGFLRGLD